MLFFTRGASGLWILLLYVALHRENTADSAICDKKDAGLDLIEPGSSYEDG